jgi:hypothetical protein
MPDSAEISDSASARRRSRLRFSLLSLFILITLVCVVFGFARRPGCKAAAAFRVGVRAPTVDSEENPFHAVEFEIFMNAQLATIKGQWLLQAVLRNPAIASLPILASRKDPVAWLQENIRVEISPHSEILMISLTGRRDQLAEVKQVVDAVATAYVSDVRYREKMRLQSKVQAADRMVESVRSDFMQKASAAAAAAKEVKDPVEAQIRQVELDQLKQLWTEAAMKLAALRADQDAPSRIEQLHQAIGSEWGFFGY